MFFLFALAILLGSFLVLFGLWLVIWSYTMSGSDVMQAWVEESRSSTIR
jgi:hypothetical protein